MSARLNNMVLLALAAAIVVLPMALGLPGEYAGADSLAKAAVEESGYQPWFDSLWAPPSGEVESMLFALQAAIGAGVLGFVLGRRSK